MSDFSVYSHAQYSKVSNYKLNPYFQIGIDEHFKRLRNIQFIGYILTSIQMVGYVGK